MSTAGWTVTDSAQAPNRGWTISDSSGVQDNAAQPFSPEDAERFYASPARAAQLKAMSESQQDFSLSPDEAERASDALMYSRLTGAPPSYAYENRDAFHEDFMTRLGGYAEAGWKGITRDSIIGEYLRGQLSGPFESEDEVSKFIEDLGQMIGDMPAYMVGGGLGLLAGGAAGTVELPVVGTISLGAVGAGAGAFGLTEGLRQWLVDKYSGNNLSAWSEVMDVLKQGGKGALVGSAFGFAGEAAPLASGPVGRFLGARAYKTAAELAAMTTVGSLVEGQVPSARDFAENAALLALMHVSMSGLEFARKSLPDVQRKTMDIYAREGVHPADIASMAAQRAIDEPPGENPMEIINKIDNEIAGIPQTTAEPEKISPETPAEEPEIEEIQPKLRPAIRQGEDIAVGQTGEHHDDIMKRQAVDGEHGFVNPEGEFLTRQQATNWVEKNEPGIAAKLDGSPLHTEQYNEATGIKNAVTREERLARGLSEVEVEARRSFGQAFDEGKRSVDQGRIDPRALAEDMAAKPRPLNAEESAALVYDRMRLQNEHAGVMQAIEEDRARGDTEKETRDKERLQDIEDAINTNDEAARRTGYEQGLGLAARRLMIKQDYSLANILQRARAASPTGEISPDLRNRLEELTRQLDEANKRIDNYEEAKRQQAAQNTVERIKRDTARAERAGRRIASKADLKTEYDSLLRDLNKELIGQLSANPFFNPKLYELFGKLAVNRIQAGYLTIEQIVDDLHAALQERGLSKREIRDYISGYGRKIELSKDELQVKLREARRQGRLLSALEDAEKKLMPLRSGLQRDKATDRVRELQRQVNEAMKKSGLSREATKSPAEQWKSSLDSIKTRLRNQITDITKILETGEKPPQKEGVPLDQEAEDLKWLRDYGQGLLDEFEGKPEMSDEQKVKMATAAVQKSIIELERRIKERDLAPKAKEPAVETPELKVLRDKRDALRETVAQMRREAEESKGAEPAQIKSLENQIADLERRIREGDTAPKGKREGPDTEKIASLKARRDALRNTLDELREQEKPKRTPEEQNLSRYKTMIQNRIAMMERQLASGDFTTPTRRTTVLDQQAEDLKAQAEKLKSQVDDAIAKQKLAARTPTEKGAALFQKWRRAVLLSSVNTLGKLTTAAMLRFGTTPIEELLGGVLSKFPVLSDIAAKAPREGAGLNISAEAKAFGQLFDKATAQDMREALRTGKTSLDYLYGKKTTLPPEALDFFGHIHGALKVLPKRAEFFRSLEKRAQWALDNHLDIQDPKVQATLAADAYIDANRAIFMQDNFVNTGFRMLINYFHSQGLSGRSAEFMIQTVLPIVKVPTNIVAETGEFAFGAITGSIRALETVIEKDGLKNLTMGQADNIMRSLKKGSIGLAVLAVGYYAGSEGGFIHSSGFYQPKDKESETLEIGGFKVPNWIMHTPVGLTFLMGATLRRVNDTYTMKGKSGALVAGALSAGLGALQKVPFLEEAGRLGEATRTAQSAGLFLDDLIQSLIIPPDIRRLAQMTDSDIRRKPTDLKQAIEENIPGLRETVPPVPRKQRFSIRGAYR